MNQTLALALLLVAATCMSITHDQTAADPYPRTFTLTINYAARQGHQFETCGMAVVWNGVKIRDIFPQNYSVSTFKTEVKADVGENTLNIFGLGNSDGFGMTIDNVRLERDTIDGHEDLIVNGGFEQGHNVGTGWKIFTCLHGWTCDSAGIEVGYGKIYNSNWHTGTHVV